jgi:hypothetical protein
MNIIRYYNILLNNFLMYYLQILDIQIIFNSDVIILYL